MIGTWRNIEELEECLTMAELELVVSSLRDKEDRQARWLAAVNGINLDDTGESAFDKVEEIKRRVAAGEEGKTGDAFDLSELGIDVEFE